MVALTWASAARGAARRRSSTAETRREAEEAIAPSAASLREKAYQTIKAHSAGIIDEAGATFSRHEPEHLETCDSLEPSAPGRIVAIRHAQETRSGRKAVTWVIAP